jgi:hypothetical protein
VLLVGAVPETVAMSVRLSPALRAAVPLAAAEVLKELERLGRPAERRSTSRPPDIWWEEEPGSADDARN